LVITEDFIKKEENKSLEDWEKNSDPDFYPFEWPDITGDILQNLFLLL
jgi:hypothetical protein